MREKRYKMIEKKALRRKESISLIREWSKE